MADNVVVSVGTMVFVVVVILGVVAVVTNHRFEHDDNHIHDNISTNTKVVDIICKPTEYKEACKKVVNEVANNSSATYKDYIIAIFRATADELQKPLEKASSANDAARADLKTCHEMLGYATDHLQQVIKVISKTKETNIAEQVDPILVWLTAIRAYQTTCLDEIKDEHLKEDMQKELQTANHLTFNAQKIVYNAFNILNHMGVDLGDSKHPSTGHRELLEELHVIDHQGFPSWISHADRKLLSVGSIKKFKAKGIAQRLFKTPAPPPLPPTVIPNAVVALDGSGQFKSIKDALSAYPPNLQGRYIIYIKAGVYNEGQIVVEKNHNNVYMYGDGRDKTIIAGDLNHGIKKIGTSQTATVVAIGERFMARGIGFKNTIGPIGQQAVAFRSQSPHTVMVDCSFEGYQGTLYYHTHDQFYKNCAISGTVDFIFGSGRAYIQDCEIYVQKPNKDQANTVTADGKMKKEEAGGVVLHNCKIMAAPELELAKQEFASYLGRPWKASATSVVMKSEIGDMIRPRGWSVWESPEGENNHVTCTFREFANSGLGSNTEHRVNWRGFKVITDEKAAIGFTASTFIDGESWLPQQGVPANLGL